MPKIPKMSKIDFYKKRMTELAKNLETYYDRIQEKLRNTSFLEKVEKKQKS